MHSHHIFIKRIEVKESDSKYEKGDFIHDIENYLELYEYDCYDYYRILSVSTNGFNNVLYDVLKNINVWQKQIFQYYRDKIDFKIVEKVCDEFLDNWKDEEFLSVKNMTCYYLNCISKMLNDNYTFDCMFVDLDKNTHKISNELLQEVQDNPTNFLYAEVDLHI